MGHIRVNLSNMNNKWIEFELTNINTFIICIGFGLTNINIIDTLTRHKHNPSTRIIILNNNDCICASYIIKH